MVHGIHPDFLTDLTALYRPVITVLAAALGFLLEAPLSFSSHAEGNPSPVCTAAISNKVNVALQFIYNAYKVNLETQRRQSKRFVLGSKNSVQAVCAHFDRKTVRILSFKSPFQE
ncbi:hypothetical protein PAMP_000771 [Pampus punctatissimus]